MNKDRSTSETFDTLTSIEEVIFSLSGKSDFEEVESQYLTSIPKLIPAHATAFYLFEPSKTAPMRIGARGVDLDFIRYYEKQGRQMDPLRGWITKEKSPNQSQRLLGLEGWRHHPVYNVVGTAGIDFAMQSPLIHQGEVIGTLNFGRDIEEGPFTSADLKTISILSSFLSLAIAGCTKASDKDSVRKNFCTIVKNIPQGIILTDQHYEVQYANSAAEKISVRNFGDSSPQNELTTLLSSNISAQGEAGSFQKDNVRARFCPVPGSEKQQSIIFLDEEMPISVTRQLGDMVTQREMEVLLLVDRGMRNREIAEELNISVNTVKRHLDNIYGKMNVSSRTELIAKIYKYLK